MNSDRWLSLLIFRAQTDRHMCFRRAQAGTALSRTDMRVYGFVMRKPKKAVLLIQRSSEVCTASRLQPFQGSNNAKHQMPRGLRSIVQIPQNVQSIRNLINFHSVQFKWVMVAGTDISQCQLRPYIHLNHFSIALHCSKRFAGPNPLEQWVFGAMRKFCYIFFFGCIHFEKGIRHSCSLFNCESLLSLFRMHCDDQHNLGFIECLATILTL